MLPALQAQSPASTSPAGTIPSNRELPAFRNFPHPLCSASSPLLFSLSIYQDNAGSQPDPLEPYFGKCQFLLPSHPRQPQSPSNALGLVDKPQQAPALRLP